MDKKLPLTAMQQAQLDIVSQKVFEWAIAEIKKNISTAEDMITKAKKDGVSMEGMYLAAVAILMLSNNGTSTRATEDLRRFGGLE